MISGNVPQHLVVGARSGFLTALSNMTPTWRRVAGEITMGSKALDLVDVGSSPMPVEDRDRGPIQSHIERSKEVKARNWSLIVDVSYNAIADDQTGTLQRKVASAGENFNQAIDDLVFKALDAGDGTTYGTAYDNLSFFNSAHVDPGAAYTTAQDNLFALAMSLDNFTTNKNLAARFVDDNGNYVQHRYDLLVVSPELEYIAAQICTNAEAYDTGNRERNPYAGMMQYLVNPNLSATTYIALATGKTQKPLYVAMREMPFLQDAWFDPMGADGGTYYFKFYGRYNVVYGDWRLGWMGNS